MHIIGTLQRAPDRDALLCIEAGDHSVIFDVKLLLRAGPVFTLHNVVGLLPDVIDIAFFHSIGLEDVVYAPNDLRLALALFHGEDGGKRIILDRNRGHCRSEKMPVGVCEKENRLLGVVHDSIRKAGLIVE